MTMIAMPQPGEEHKKLAQLSGTWVGDERIHPTQWDPRGGTARGTMVGRMGLGGLYLICDYKEERDGRVTIEGHGVYGWDPRGRCYTMHWFDSSGIEHGAPAIGTWEGNTLTLVHEMTQFGQSRYIYEILGPAEHRLRLENSADGKTWTPFLEGTYRLQNA